MSKVWSGGAWVGPDPADLVSQAAFDAYANFKGLFSAVTTDQFCGPSSTAETTIATHTVPQGDHTGRVLRFTAFGDSLTNNSTTTLRWRLKLGATTVLDSGADSITTNAQRAKWRAQVDFMFIAAAQQKIAGAHSERRDANTWSDSGLFVHEGYSGVIAEDLSAASKLVVLTAQLNVNGALTDVVCRGSFLEWV